uniref:Uncharacterized protein n=1 Tax=Agrobacterium fabrum TaxID=1176649 RepID=A0A2Z2PMB3_9HYPH|nr:hypothetical protein [Agrobacterium fabrum]
MSDRRAAAPRSFSRNGIAPFLPLRPAFAFLAVQESRLPPPSIAFRSLGMRSDRPRSNRQSSRTRWSRPDQTERITTMAIIGEFTTNGNTILGFARSYEEAAHIRTGNAFD